jgi:hypothetical protein
MGSRVTAAREPEVLNLIGRRVGSSGERLEKGARDD